MCKYTVWSSQGYLTRKMLALQKDLVYFETQDILLQQKTQILYPDLESVLTSLDSLRRIYFTYGWRWQDETWHYRLSLRKGLVLFYSASLILLVLVATDISRCLYVPGTILGIDLFIYLWDRIYLKLYIYPTITLNPWSPCLYFPRCWDYSLNTSPPFLTSKHLKENELSNVILTMILWDLWYWPHFTREKTGSDKVLA